MTSNKFCVGLTHANDDPDRATVAFVIANAALGSEKETSVFLSTEGVRVASAGYVDDIHEEGFLPLKELMDNFAEGGRADNGLRPVLPQAWSGREQPCCRRCHCRRSVSHRVPLQGRADGELLGGRGDGPGIRRAPLWMRLLSIS